METFAGAALIVFGMIVFGNYANGTLPQWLRAKFFNDDGSNDPHEEAPGPFGQAPPTGGLNPVTPASVRTGLGGPLGPLVMPVSGARVTGTFGEARPGHIHAGVDLAAPTGTPVVAARGGRVLYAGAAGDYGLRVDIDHGNGIVTRYAHLSSIGVRVGQALRAGEQLGRVGSTGHATGPHLHFELRQFGKAIDPWLYLGPAKAVLV